MTRTTMLAGEAVSDAEIREMLREDKIDRAPPPEDVPLTAYRELPDGREVQAVGRYVPGEPETYTSPGTDPGIEDLKLFVQADPQDPGSPFSQPLPEEALPEEEREELEEEMLASFSP